MPANPAVSRPEVWPPESLRSIMMYVDAPVTPQQKLKYSLRLGPTLRLIWRCCPGWTVAGAVLAVVQGILPLVPVYVLKLIVDTIEESVRSADPAHATSRIIFLVAAAGLAASIDAACGSLARVVRENQSETLTDYVQSIIYGKSIAMDLQYYENPDYYDTLHRAQREAPHRPQGIIDGLTQLGQSCVSLAAVLGLLISLNWVIALVLFVGVVPSAVVRLRFARVMDRWQREKAQAERKAWYLGWLLSGDVPAKELRLFELGSTLLSRFNDLRQRLRTEHLRIVRNRSWSDFVSQLLAAAAFAGSLAYLAMRAVRGAISIGDLVLYVGVLQRGMGSMQQIMSDIGGLYEDNLFMSYVQEFLSMSPCVRAPARPSPVPRPITEGFRVKDVSFRYPSDKTLVLREISMEIRRGETTAIVGENGSGKTTLVKLLSRLYDPLDGTITLDGTDLRNVDPADLHGHIAAVMQDFMRYDFSAKENVWLGDVRKPVDLHGIRDAARCAGIDDVLWNLPGAYETLLGRMFDDAHELSIGEWQKVALARAFFRDAQVIILDEPTSAMDALAEHEFFTRFSELAKGKTIVLISHRFSTVRMADRIYVVDGGSVIESGTHEELVSRGGKYATMYALQASSYR